MSNITALPTLYKRTSTGKVQVWTVKVDGDQYWTESGQQGGKLVVSKPRTAKAKNVGRSNETTPEQQALKEAQAKWDKKVDGAYFQDIDDIDDKPFQPTLAHPIEKHANKMEHKDVMLSPKLDGVRCYITKDGAFSRENNQFVTTKSIEKELEYFFDLYPDAILDGELYNHELKEDFNAIISLVKKTKNISKKDWKRIESLLQFHIFDIAGSFDKYDENSPYFARRNWLEDQIEENGRIKFVENKYSVTFSLDLEDEENTATKFFNQCIELGYEGIMVRHSGMSYERKRTHNLLKIKEFETEEFEIVDIIEGKGNRSGMFGKFVLKLPNGETFKANARGSYEYYKQIWDNQSEYIGKMATHRFMNYTPDGVPRGGAVIAIRDYE